MNMCFKNFAYYFLFTVMSFAGGTALVDTSLHDFLIISLDGTTVEQFNNTIQLGFQELIAKLAVDYCIANGFQNYGVINSSTVEINKVEKCPEDWPESEFCINVNVSVPINSSTSYELNNRNLYSMWKTHTSAQLQNLAVTEYNIPSSSTILILWLCVTGILFILFLSILIVAVKTKFIEKYIRRRRDMLGSANRSWLAQHGEKQLVPPFFYPEPPTAKLKETRMEYTVSEGSVRQRSFGIENPGYAPDMVIPRLEKQTSRNSGVVDDFDSDDETIYPPSPLPRLASRRKKKESGAEVSADELETAF